MAYQGKRTTGFNTVLQQFGGILVISQVFHWTVATRVKDEVIVSLVNISQIKRVVQLRVDFSEVVLVFRALAVGQDIEAVLVYYWSLCIRRREVNVPSSVFEYAVWSNQFFGPVTGRAGAAVGQRPFICGSNYE